MQEISGWAAAFTALPPLEFSDGESKELAKRLREVQKHFPVLPLPNAKYVAIAALVMTAGKITKTKMRAVAEYKAGFGQSPIIEQPTGELSPGPMGDNIAWFQVPSTNA